MEKLLKCLAVAMLVALCCAASADAHTKIGVGVEGPVSAETEREVELAVGKIPGAKVVPIVPPGDAAACVRRFVAGDPDDRLDALLIVRLPSDAYRTDRRATEASFNAAYEVYTLDLSTMAEDRRRFAFSDAENVTGGIGAYLALPAQIVSERATGKRLVAGSSWQATQDVQVRVESKFLASLRDYLSSAPIRSVHPLDPLECAHHLLEAGDTQSAMIVLKSAGAELPQSLKSAHAQAQAKEAQPAPPPSPQTSGAQSRTQQASAMLASARVQMAQSRALAILGRTLGAIVAGDAQAAESELASYEGDPQADSSRAAELKRTISAMRAARGDKDYDAAVKADVLILDRSGFLAMIKRVFGGETGSEPTLIELKSNGIEIADAGAPNALRTRLDGYATALGQTARLMSLRCGCDADATLRAERAGAVLMRARFGTSFARPEVGIP